MNPYERALEILAEMADEARGDALIAAGWEKYGDAAHANRIRMYALDEAFKQVLALRPQLPEGLIGEDAYCPACGYVAFSADRQFSLEWTARGPGPQA